MLTSFLTNSLNYRQNSFWLRNGFTKPCIFFVSYTKEFPDFMTVRLSNFFGKFENIFEISKQIKTFLTPGTSLVLKTKTKTNILSKFLLLYF